MREAATEQLVEFQLLVGGQQVGAARGATYDSIDPYTGKPWARVPDGDATDIDRAVTAAREALDGQWADSPRPPAASCCGGLARFSRARPRT
ncbi:aldehyde dehydrogenase family protein [Mycobacterium xenopi 3993]|nr:aldehyde dehydrogenase family protein [Mycobacterium xenopi 3993]